MSNGLLLILERITMKKIVFLIALFLYVGVNAQTPEKKAQKFTDEITRVLELNADESKAVYEIQLERFKESQAIEKEFGNDPEAKKEKQKEIGNKTFNKMKAVLGTERQKKWKAYKGN
jgi:polyhydroxyalkanoate synthesis regulator phasin